MLRQLIKISETRIAWGYWGAATRPRSDLTNEEIAAREMLVKILDKMNINLISFHEYIKVAVETHSTLSSIIENCLPNLIKDNEKLQIRIAAYKCVVFQQGKRENSTSIVNSLPQEIVNEIYNHVCPIESTDKKKRKTFIHIVSKNKAALFAKINAAKETTPVIAEKNLLRTPRSS